MISIKTDKEILIMKEGGKILAEILKKLSEAVTPGITTNDLEEITRELVSFHGVEPSFLGYKGFPAALCVSVNDEIVHGVPSDRILKDGDLLKLDMGVLHKGFHTDSAITVIVGNRANNDIRIKTSRVVMKRKLISVTKEALSIGISKAKAGNTLGDIGAAIQKHVESNGFNVTRELVGHGIGREVHESPHVFNYGKAGTGSELIEGMVLAIEPIVLAGDWKIKLDKDGFTYKTKDGKLSAHFEHTVAIVDNEPVILTQ